MTARAIASRSAKKNEVKKVKPKRTRRAVVAPSSREEKSRPGSGGGGGGGGQDECDVYANGANRKEPGFRLVQLPKDEEKRPGQSNSNSPSSSSPPSSSSSSAATRTIEEEEEVLLPPLSHVERDRRRWMACVRRLLDVGSPIDELAEQLRTAPTPRRATIAMVALLDHLSVSSQWIGTQPIDRVRFATDLGLVLEAEMRKSDNLTPLLAMSIPNIPTAVLDIVASYTPSLEWDVIRDGLDQEMVERMDTVASDWTVNRRGDKDIPPGGLREYNPVTTLCIMYYSRGRQCADLSHMSINRALKRSILEPKKQLLLIKALALVVWGGSESWASYTAFRRTVADANVSSSSSSSSSSAESASAFLPLLLPHMAKWQKWHCPNWPWLGNMLVKTLLYQSNVFALADFTMGWGKTALTKERDMLR